MWPQVRLVSGTSMLAGLGHAFSLLHGIFFVALAAFHVWVWARRGFRIPRYIHVMAFVAAMISWWGLEMSPPDAPVRKGGPLEVAWVFLALPAPVYGAYVLFGGALADPEKKQVAS